MRAILLFASALVVVAVLSFAVLGVPRTLPPSELHIPDPVDVVPAGRAEVLVWGDSIAVGGWPQRLGWEADARGERTFHGDRSAIWRLIVNGSPAIWIALGTNDYYFSRWSAKDFGRTYGDVLDALKGRQVYAQTPLLRAKEPPNLLGDTLSDYRDAIMSECKKRAWVTCIDGTALVPVTMMPDGVHPSDEGQIQYARVVSRTLQNLRESDRDTRLTAE